MQLRWNTIKDRELRFARERQQASSGDTKPNAKQGRTAAKAPE
ncbi:hypothetical protein [Rhodanobacter umsongensis]